MSFSGYMVDFGFSGIGYLILAVQVHGGGPPFYGTFGSLYFQKLESPVERALAILVPYIFGVFGAMFLIMLTKVAAFVSVIGLLSIWAGLRVRKDLRRYSDGPRPWITNIWILKWPVWSVKWPMLIFDIWTVGLPLAVVALRWAIQDFDI